MSKYILEVDYSGTNFKNSSKASNTSRDFQKKLLSLSAQNSNENRPASILNESKNSSVKNPGTEEETK